MKKLYPAVSLLPYHFFASAQTAVFVLLFPLFCLCGLKSMGQITPGDFVIVGFNGNAATVNIAIAALKNIPSGTVLKITDQGWNQTALVTNGSDGLITWTTTAIIPAGTLFNVSITGGASPTATGLSAYGTSTAVGWATGTVVAGGGDNWFLYTGSDASPSFVYGFANWSTALPGTNAPDPVTGWQAAGTVSAAVSYLPTTLAAGNFFITLTIAGTPPTGYHGDFNNYAGTVAGTKATLLGAIGTKSNWVSTEILANKKSLDPGGAAFPGSNPIFQMSTLPLTLLSVTGKEVREAVYLQWTTANEVNTAAFDIERSANGAGYVTISSVAANSINTYNYTDNNVMAGSVYTYRLKMRDIDGRYTYSFIVSVRYAGKSAAGYLIYPNPVTGSFLYLKSFAGTNTGVQAAIIDVSGSTLYKVLLSTVSNGNGYFKIPVTQLTAGSYVLQIADNNGKRLQVIKFMVTD